MATRNLTRTCDRCGAALNRKQKHYCSLSCAAIATRQPPLNPADRFWPKVNKGNALECWPWNGFISPRGYGMFRLGRGSEPRIGAHRYSWILANGEIHGDDIQVCHTCDNRRCVNPAHLFLGTQTDNIRDAISKGRFIYGSRSGRSKLKEADIVAIRSARAGGELAMAIAKRYGVTDTTVYSICKRKLWTHVA